MCNSAELISWTVIFAVESLVIFAVNVITIVIFWKLRFVLKRTYYLLINLTVADLIVGFGVLEIVTKNSWKVERSERLEWGRFIFLDIFSGTASMTSLLLIAVERFCAIVLPLRHRTLTKGNYMHCIAGVWIASLLTTMVRLAPEFVLRNSVLAIVSSWILTSSIAVCLILICGLYTAIWFSSNKDDPRIRRDKRVRNKRLAKTLFIVTTISVITWLPFSMTFVLPQHVKIQENCIVYSVLFGTRFMQLANSLINPAVYCYRMHEFNRTLKQNIFKWCRIATKASDPSSQNHFSSKAKLPVLLSLSNLNEVD